jgi:hypothetical protein
LAGAFVVGAVVATVAVLRIVQAVFNIQKRNDRNENP